MFGTLFRGCTPCSISVSDLVDEDLKGCYIHGSNPLVGKWTFDWEEMDYTEKMEIWIFLCYISASQPKAFLNIAGRHKNVEERAVNTNFPCECYNFSQPILHSTPFKPVRLKALFQASSVLNYVHDPCRPLFPFRHLQPQWPLTHSFRSTPDSPACKRDFQGQLHFVRRGHHLTDML